MRGSNFLYVCCQVGSEPALKKELARAHPELRFAYSRPGFVTFKREGGAPFNADFELRSVFARAYGVSCGKTSPGELAPILELANEVASEGGRGAGLKGVPLHVWERDQHAPGEAPKGFVAGVWAGAARAALASQGMGLASPPAVGELALDVIAVEESEWWFGYHRRRRWSGAWAGGDPGVALPAEAPSRAWTKLEEALLWSGAPLRRGDCAVEIGSAPGGAVLNLLNRGLDVVGIDPGEMAEPVARNPRFMHFRVPVAQVPREQLPDEVHWLLLDMNVEPRISLYAVDRLAARVADSLCGLILTCKLNQWRIAGEIPSMLDHVRAMGAVEPRAIQLPSHGQEILIYGLTKLGAAR